MYCTTTTSRFDATVQYGSAGRCSCEYCCDACSGFDTYTYSAEYVVLRRPLWIRFYITFMEAPIVAPVSTGLRSVCSSFDFPVRSGFGR